MQEYSSMHTRVHNYTNGSGMCFFPYNIRNGMQKRTHIPDFDYSHAHLAIVQNGLHRVHFGCIQLKTKHLNYMQKHNPHD